MHNNVQPKNTIVDEAKQNYLVEFIDLKVDKKTTRLILFCILERYIKLWNTFLSFLHCLKSKLELKRGFSIINELLVENVKKKKRTCISVCI